MMMMTFTVSKDETVCRSLTARTIQCVVHCQQERVGVPFTERACCELSERVHGCVVHSQHGGSVCRSLKERAAHCQ